MCGSRGHYRLCDAEGSRTIGTFTSAIRVEQMLSLMEKFIKDYRQLREKWRQEEGDEAFLAGLREYLTSGDYAQTRPIELFIKGRVALQEGHLDQAELFFDELLHVQHEVHAQHEVEEPGAQVLRAWALFDKALICCQKGLSDDVVAAIYDEMITELNGAKDPELQEWHSTALLGKAHICFRQGKFDEAIALYDRIADCYEGSEEFELRKICACASFYKASCLAGKGESDLAIMQFDNFLARFGDSRYDQDNLTIQAIGHRGEVLHRRKRLDEALMNYNDFLERARNSTDSFIRECAAVASLNKAEILAVQGHADEALSVISEVQRSLQDVQGPQFDKILAFARSKAQRLTGRRVKKRPSVFRKIRKCIQTVLRLLRNSFWGS